MKRLIYIIISIAFLLQSCDKMPTDSRLDGMWQLISIERAEGTTDTKPQRIYWCFRRELVQYTSDGGEILFSHVSHRGDSLLFRDFFHDSKSAVEGDDNQPVLPSEAPLLHGYGVWACTGNGALSASFHIDRLSSDRLVLRNDSFVITFRKF